MTKLKNIKTKGGKESLQLYNFARDIFKFEDFYLNFDDKFSDTISTSFNILNIKFVDNSKLNLRLIIF